MRRRDFMVTGLKGTALMCGGLSLLGQPATARALMQQPGAGRKGPRGNLTEWEAGDPDAPPERLILSPAQRQNVIITADKSASRGDKKDPQAISEAMLRIAKDYIGVNRTKDPEQVATFLRLFGLDLRYGPGQGYVPYCAAGASFIACQAYCETRVQQDFDPKNPNVIFRDVLKDINNYYFRPHPACWVMVQDAKNRNNWIGKQRVAATTPKPGWLVFYNWKGKASPPKHVGIVDRREGDQLHTVEFNTSRTAQGSQSNGGAVSDKVRSLKYVMGYISTY
jgi:hypothetical protein